MPRNQNEEADAITNGDFSAFIMENRIRIDLTEANRGLVFGDMLDAGRVLFKEMETLKEQKKRVASKGVLSASSWKKGKHVPLPAWQ